MPGISPKSLSILLVTTMALAGCMGEVESEEEKYEREKAEALANLDCPEGYTAVYDPPHTGCWPAN